jgi:peptide/nickel transport system substrate-binding protein
MTLHFAYPSEVSRPYMPDPQKLYDAMKTDLEAIGIKVDTSHQAVERWLPRRRLGLKYDAFLLGWTGDYDSADNFIGTFFGNLKTNRLPHQGPGLRASPVRRAQGRGRHRRRGQAPRHTRT